MLTKSTLLVPRLTYLALLCTLCLMTSTYASPIKTSGLKASVVKDKEINLALPHLSIQGGSSITTGDSVKPKNSPVVYKPSGVKNTFSRVALATWGVLQVVLVIGNAVRRLVPIALQPFKQNDFKPYEWGLYGVWMLYMIYTEGYQAFQTKFSPLLVKRAFLLQDNLSILRVIFAGPYTMGLFGATKKRMIVSWAVSIGVFGLVAIVKRLPYPYRSIIDAGVVAGLTYGTLSTLFIFIRGLCGELPDVDPCHPTPSSDSTSTGTTTAATSPSANTNNIKKTK